MIINQKVFIYKETIVPLNNISRISITNEKGKSYGTYAFVLLLFGVICLFTRITALIVLGLNMMGIGAWAIYRTYTENQELGEYLIFNLNSGKDLYLYIREHVFFTNILSDAVSSGLMLMLTRLSL